MVGSIASYTSVTVDTQVMKAITAQRDLSNGGWAQTSLCRSTAEPMMETGLAYTTGFYVNDEKAVMETVNLGAWTQPTAIDLALYNISSTSAATDTCGVWAEYKYVFYAADLSMKTIIGVVVLVVAASASVMILMVNSEKSFREGVLQVIASTSGAVSTNGEGRQEKWHIETYADQKSNQLRTSLRGMELRGVIDSEDKAPLTVTETITSESALLKLNLTVV
ncbi:unnamed protein product [Umbelopsis vinacea]